MYHYSMKKSLFMPILLAATVLIGCRDDNSQLGQSLVESAFRNVFVDTCTVDISTVRMDSMVTRGDSICQIGHYRDTVWGEVYSTYYAEYSTADITPNETPNM